VRWIDEVLEIALTARPVPRVQTTTVAAAAASGKRRGKPRAPKIVQAH
jgi:hypothetical protein